MTFKIVIIKVNIPYMMVGDWMKNEIINYNKKGN